MSVCGYIFNVFTVSGSYAGALFADACLKGLNGVPDVVECSFVQSSITELPFFASKVIGYVLFGPLFPSSAFV